MAKTNVEVKNGKVYVDGKERGRETSRGIEIDGKIYRENGGTIYADNEEVGYKTGNEVRMKKDRSLWKGLFS